MKDSIIVVKEETGEWFQFREVGAGAGEIQVLHCSGEDRKRIKEFVRVRKRGLKLLVKLFKDGFKVGRVLAHHPAFTGPNGPIYVVKEGVSS